jgi:hypothetical protein
MRVFEMDVFSIVVATVTVLIFGFVLVGHWFQGHPIGNILFSEKRSSKLLNLSFWVALVIGIATVFLLSR